MHTEPYVQIEMGLRKETGYEGLDRIKWLMMV